LRVYADTSKFLSAVSLGRFNLDKMSFLTHNWHNEFEGFAYSHKVDLIVDSDILFMSNAVRPLVARIDELLSADGIALIVDPGRANWETFGDSFESDKFIVLQERLPSYGTPFGVIKLVVVTVIVRRTGTAFDGRVLLIRDTFRALHAQFKVENATVFTFCMNSKT
jgi:SAM-dependent methyltransferase